VYVMGVTRRSVGHIAFLITASVRFQITDVVTYVTKSDNVL
jgi:hypothetical protein